MKTASQLIASVLSLGSLLGMAANSHATDIADLPLKASVLAKPNVIFGLDDSGSMDWEVLLDTSSGLFWWDGDDGWNNAKGKPASATGNNDDIRSYLFPLGSNDGGQLYSYDSRYGRALPPTSQFAWMRSSRFNPVYYDSKATYKPWAPAYVSGVDLPAYPNANPDAALAHALFPAGPSLKLNADWDASAVNWGSNGYRFFVQGGMKVPAGSNLFADSEVSGACNGGTARTVTAELTVAAGKSCYASIPYYPATFWNAEDCVIGADCVLGPDGVTKLKRYEIKAGTPSYPSGRDYAGEMQNFANWFTYYRKRKLMLAGSMGQVLEGLTGLRLGVVSFNEPAAVTMKDTDAAQASKNARYIAGLFYKNALEADGTPTHATVKYIAGEFDTNASVVQYACQRNSMFIVTDGFSNTTSIAVPGYNAGKSANTWGQNSPYQAIADGSLSDLALRYYTNRLRAGDLAAGKVPISKSDAPNADKNPDLHINTYAITLGVRGSLWPNTVDPFEVAPNWPVPTANDPSMIDDQWHATINGRGLMFLATTPDETITGIRNVFNDILSQVGAQGGIAVSTVNLPRGDSMAYFGTYNPAGWAGDLTANKIDAKTGSVALAPTWSAGAKLLARDWKTRVIAASVAGAGAAFTVGNVAATVNPGAKYGADAAVVDYLRGDRSGEGTAFRARTSLLGAVINSEPAVSRDDGVVYVSSGEGMLHAFDTKGAGAGDELWAFVPRQALAEIGETVERGYAFHTKFDGSPVLGKFSAAGKLLVSGMGAAGSGYFALDVSNPRGLNEAGLASKLKWEFPKAGDAVTQAKVGQTLGRPVFVKTEDDGYVVLLTSGYNSSADGGRVWMLNADTGAVIKEFVVAAGTAGTEVGLAHLVAFGESTGTVRYAYGGDLLGNLWRFDLKAKDAPAKVATLVGPGGKAQPITAAPELMFKDGQRIVFVGTGRLLDISDFGSSDVQSIYAIADVIGSPTLVNARASLVQQTYDRATDSMSNNAVDWTAKRGWYIDLPAGEQLNTRPTLAYGGLAFVSNINGKTDCTASSYLYVVDATSGKKFQGTKFVSTLVSNSSTSSGVTALLTTGQKIVGAGQDADGKPWERDITSGSPILPGKNSWIEIRRQ
jgi:type IV pilus assembly protein PilY1